MPKPYTLHFDGASRGNPGPAGCGFVITSPSGDIVKQNHVRLQPSTNNVAEYQGLLHGLAAAKSLNIRSLAIYGDSRLVIEQVRGTWKVKKDHLVPFATEAKQRIKEFSYTSLQWVPRSQNALADAEANKAF